jgi:hypothetical protein
MPHTRPTHPTRTPQVSSHTQLSPTQSQRPSVLRAQPHLPQNTSPTDPNWASDMLTTLPWPLGPAVPAAVLLLPTLPASSCPVCKRGPESVVWPAGGYGPGPALGQLYGVAAFVLSTSHEPGCCMGAMTTRTMRSAQRLHHRDVLVCVAISRKVDQGVDFAQASGLGGTCDWYTDWCRACFPMRSVHT